MMTNGRELVMCVTDSKQRYSLQRGSPAAWFVDAAKEGNTIYFSGWNLNGIFSMNLDNGLVELISKFPGARDGAKCLYSLIQKHGKLLYFFPHRAKQIVSFDLEERKFAFYDAGFQDEIRFGFHRYLDSTNHVVWLLAYNGKLIIRFSLLDSDITAYDICSTDVKNVNDNSDLVYVGNCLWFLYRHSNMLIQFNMIDGDSCCHTVGSNNWTGIASDGQVFYLADENGSIYKWDHHHSRLESLINLPVDKEPFQLILRDGWLFVFYLDSPNYVVVNVSNREIKKFFGLIDDSVSYCFTPGMIGDDIFLFTHGLSASFLRILHGETGGGSMSAILPHECIDTYYSCCVEDISTDLLVFCRHVTNKFHRFDSIKQCNVISCGDVIYHSVLST